MSFFINKRFFEFAFKLKILIADGVSRQGQNRQINLDVGFEKILDQLYMAF